MLSCRKSHSEEIEERGQWWGSGKVDTGEKLQFGCAFRGAMCWGTGLGVGPGGDSLLSCGDVTLPENSLVQLQAGCPHPCGSPTKAITQVFLPMCASVLV